MFPILWLRFSSFELQSGSSWCLPWFPAEVMTKNSTVEISLHFPRLEIKMWRLTPIQPLSCWSLSYNWLNLIQVVWKYNFSSAISFSYLWHICSHDITIYATRLLLFWIKVAFAYVQIAVLSVQKTQQTLLDFFNLQQYQQVIYVSNEFFFTW